MRDLELRSYKTEKRARKTYNEWVANDREIDENDWDRCWKDYPEIEYHDVAERWVVTRGR